MLCDFYAMASEDLPLVAHDLVGTFDEQVKHTLDNVRLARHEVENLSNLFQDLQQTLQGYWPDCRILPFGSIVTGLGIKTSDADCFIDLPQHCQRPGEKYVITAKAILKRHGSRFRELFAITTAKVPIVKFFHAPTRRHCDINFHSFAGVRNSKLLAELLHLDDRAMPLAVLVKYWSKVHKLTGTNLVPNYALTLMVVFYLQTLKILPSVKELQSSGDAYIVDHWDTRFSDSFVQQSDSDKTLFELLGGFFEYYSTFKYSEDVISPYLGCSFKSKTFEKLDDVLNDFRIYKYNIRNNFCKPLRVNTPMCVQDPFDHSRNGAGGVHPRLAQSFILHLKYAADCYKNKTKDEFLKSILLEKQIPLPPKPIMNHIQNKQRNSNIKKNKVMKYIQTNMNIHHLYMELNRRKRNRMNMW